MPNSSPCTCPVIWAFAPEAATIAPGCQVHRGAVQRQIADGDLKPKELDLPERPVKALTQGAFQRIPRGRQYAEQETTK